MKVLRFGIAAADAVRAEVIAAMFGADAELVEYHEIADADAIAHRIETERPDAVLFDRISRPIRVALAANLDVPCYVPVTVEERVRGRRDPLLRVTDYQLC